MLDQKKRTLKRLGIAGVATAMTTMGVPGIAGAATLRIAPSATAATTTIGTPGAPTGLTATDVSADHIKLSWKAPSGSVQGYNVYEGTTSGAESTTPVNKQVLVAGTSTTVTTATTGTYFFEVAAVNVAGQGPASTEVNAAAAAIAPSAPTGVSVTPSAGAVTVTWTAPSTGDTPTSYTVNYGTSATSLTSSKTISGSPPATSLYIGGLTDGTTYFFDVAATNAAGTSSVSAVASATPTTTVVAPAPTLTAIPKNSSITLTWAEPSSTNTTATTTSTENSIQGFNVYEGSTSGGESATPLNGSIPITGTTVNVPATNGTTEFFEVKAVNSVGLSPASNEASATAEPSATPSAPTALSATAGYKAVTLKWTTPSASGNSAIKDYQVWEYKSSSPVTTATQVSTASTTSTTVAVSSASTDFSFYVKAVNADGEVSSPSNTVSDVLADVDTAPSAPQALAASTSLPTSATLENKLTWQPPANAGSAAGVSYDVYRGTTFLATVTTNNYTDSSSSLQPNTPYSYTVKAVNNFGVSAAAGPVSITTNDVTPGAPTSLTVSALSVSATAGASTATLTWNAPSVQGAGTLQYQVLEGTSPGTETTKVGGLVNGTTETVNGLSAGDTYYFEVEAVTDNAAVSAGTTTTAATSTYGTSGLSNEAKAYEDTTAPNPPANLKAAPASSTSIKLSWSAPTTTNTVSGAPPVLPASSYDILQKNSAGTYVQIASGVTTTSFVDTGLKTGTSYSFEVTAVGTDSAGGSHVSGPAGPVAAVPGPTAPGTPTAVSAIDEGNLVHLSWKAPSSDGGASIVGYNIYESGTSFGATAGSTPLNGTTLVTGTSANIDGLTAGTPVDLYVQAVNSASLTSTDSAPAEITPGVAATPSAPGTPQVKAESDGRAYVVWTPPASDGGSPIEGYLVTAHLLHGTGKTVFVRGTSTTVTGLMTGTYYFTVVAKTAVGIGTPSAPSSFVKISSTVSVTKVYVTPPAARVGAGDVIIRVTVNAPSARVQLFDEAAGKNFFFSKAIMETTPAKYGNGVAEFIVHVDATNHFYVMVNGVKSNVVTAMVK